MLVKFDLSVQDIEALPRATAENLFSEILRASRLGFHRIVIPRGVAHWAEAELGLSSIDRAHLIRLRQEYTQIAGLVAQSSLYVSVVPRVGLQNHPDNRVEISHTELIEKQFLDQSVLLIENSENDGALFDVIFKHEANRIFFGDLSYAKANGGGATIARELKQFFEAGRFVASICDTDQNLPNGPKSSTCNSLRSMAGKLNFVGIAVETPCREVENFLPLSVFFELYPHSQELEKLSGLLARQGEAAPGDCIWLFLDLKMGSKDYSAICDTRDKIEWACRKFGVQAEKLEEISYFGFGAGIVSTFVRSHTAQKQFLRNSLGGRQRCQFKAECLGAPLKVGQDPAAVAFLIRRGAWVLIGHAKSNGIIEQNGDLARGGGHRLLFANAG